MAELADASHPGPLCATRRHTRGMAGVPTGLHTVWVRIPLPSSSRNRGALASCASGEPEGAHQASKTQNPECSPRPVGPSCGARGSERPYCFSRSYLEQGDQPCDNDPSSARKTRRAGQLSVSVVSGSPVSVRYTNAGVSVPLSPLTTWRLMFHLLLEPAGRPYRVDRPIPPGTCPGKGRRASSSLSPSDPAALLCKQTPRGEKGLPCRTDRRICHSRGQ